MCKFILTAISLNVRFENYWQLATNDWELKGGKEDA